jgi:uncharacterized protein YheU (UPF0270 family)
MREGTDYGHSDYSLSDKVADVERLLKQGKAVIIFDPKTESCDLLTKHQWLERQARESQE